jgi:DNA-directed RNA polymerase subunit omega
LKILYQQGSLAHLGNINIPLKLGFLGDFRVARVTVEDCLDKVPNRFALVLLVAKRAKQLLRGVTPTSATKTSNKYIVNSLREVASNKVKFHEEEGALSPEDQIVKDLNR